MLDSQNRLQNYLKNAKTTKFRLELAFYASEGHTCKVLSFYDFWFTLNDKFSSPYPIVEFYAYLITKIGNRNLKEIISLPCLLIQRNKFVTYINKFNWIIKISTTVTISWFAKFNYVQ